MRRPRTSPAELVKPSRLAMAVLLVVASSLALAAGPAAASPSYTLEERANAIASPSLVFLEFRSEGFMRIRATGAPVETASLSVYSRCSGFVVNPDGYVVTATHCLDPAALRPVAASIVANHLIRDGKLTDAQKPGYVAQLQQSADFTGTSSKTPPAVTVKAQVYKAVTGDTDTKTIAATVVASQALASGETTLVKLDQSGLPAAQLADEPLPTSLRVVAMGFGTNDAHATKVSYTARFRAATIAGDYGKATPPRYQMDDDLDIYSAGGMVTDGDGKVIGMITNDITAKDQANKIVTPTSTITRLLDANQVKNTLGPVDQTYREGLDAYFGGHYRQAITKLDAVLAATPDNMVAQTYRNQANTRLAVEGDPDSGGGTTTVILSVAGGVVVLALMAVAVFFVVRSRRREREFTYFDPYGANQYPTSSGPTSSGPVSSVPVSGWLAAAPTSGMPTAAQTSGWPAAAPTSGMTPVTPVPVPVVPISGVPASPYAPPDGFYHPPPLPPQGQMTPPPTAYPVIVPVPPPTPMSVSPQYGQALPEPWAPPTDPVPVPGPVEPPTGTLYPQQTIPRSPVETPPEAPVTGPPAGPPVGAEPPTGQPWDVPDEERMFGSPPDAYRHRP